MRLELGIRAGQAPAPTHPPPSGRPELRVSRKVCLEALTGMEAAFRDLERQVPPPIEVPCKGGSVLRYKEQTIHQALVQKLARLISGLHAIDVLLLNGFVQEQAVIQRTLDEIGEDILFLALGIAQAEVTPLHQEYLAAFWEEEFDDEDPLKSTQKRPMPRRKRIRAYNSRAGGLNDTSAADGLGHTISRTYSGYVHAASPQVMDMCLGDPPRFQLQGMRNTIRMQEHSRDGWNYFYRGLVSTMMVAKAFGEAELVDDLYGLIARFEAASGTKYMGGRFEDL